MFPGLVPLNFVLCVLILAFQVQLPEPALTFQSSKYKAQSSRLIMQIRSILPPTDFSECGNYALSYAASLARTFRASIICVHVIEPMVPTVGYSGMTEPLPIADITEQLDRKSTRLNSSHLVISYAVFCLKKKNRTK